MLECYHATVSLMWTCWQVDLPALVKAGLKTVTVRIGHICMKGALFIFVSGRSSFLCAVVRMRHTTFADLTQQEMFLEGFMPRGDDQRSKLLRRVLMRRVLSFFAGKWIRDGDAVTVVRFKVVHAL